jgi:hypothetical protein
VAPRLIGALSLVGALSLGAAGCVTSVENGDGNAGLGGLAPVLSVERFLQAANAGDLEEMARLFGNADGSFADRSGGSFSCAFKKMGSWIGLGDACLDRTEIELRMNAIAIAIQHDDYRIRSEAQVAGRDNPTTRIGVDIDRGGETFADVGFAVVQSTGGRWLVEQIDLAAVTASRSLDLDELPEDAAGAFRMHERHLVSTRSRTGRGVDQLGAVFVEPTQRVHQIGDTVGDVV